MFSENELKHIYECITDEDLKSKIHDMIFVNNQVVKDIIDCFSKDNFYRIEKSPDTNTYYVHFLGDLDVLELIKKSNQIYDNYNKSNSNLEIEIVLHENINDLWYHNDYKQIFYVSPIYL